MNTLLQLTETIAEALDAQLGRSVFLLKAELADVKKQPGKRWCFLKFVEKKDDIILAELRGVCWATSYVYIERFEKLTGKTFGDGLEVVCQVQVRYHTRYGLSAEITRIDTGYTLGKVEEARQETMRMLLERNSSAIRKADDHYITPNNSLPLPKVIQRIALIAAPESDGERDFLQELYKNPYGYAYKVDLFHTTVQGVYAVEGILSQLKAIEQVSDSYHVVVMVRGGGSVIDFSPFDSLEVSEAVALLPVPVFTGIGHDRNVSITDLMARICKTPTKAAAVLIQHNFNFEQEITRLFERARRSARQLLGRHTEALNMLTRLLKSYHPSSALHRGYALVEHQGSFVSSALELSEGSTVRIRMSDGSFASKVTNLSYDQYDL